MTSSEDSSYFTITLTTLLTVTIIAVCHIPIYFLLFHYYHNPPYAFIITYLIYTTIVAIYYIFHPYTTQPTQTTTEEK